MSVHRVGRNFVGLGFQEQSSVDCCNCLDWSRSAISHMCGVVWRCADQSIHRVGKLCLLCCAVGVGAAPFSPPIGLLCYLVFGWELLFVLRLLMNIYLT